ncbi:MAG TPA: lipid II flippase MurJ [bacterium]|nr:lipid II flippase MurJ [bacterium]
MNTPLNTQMSRRRLAAQTLLLTGGTFALKILAYVKLAILASFFGTTSQNDAYVFALLLPSLIANVMTNSAAPALLPLFADLLFQGKREDAWRMAWTMVVSVTLILTLAFLGVAVFYGRVVAPLASGFSPETRQICTQLFYIAGPSMILASVSACLRSLFQCLERFAVMTITQIVGLIVGIISLIALKPAYGIHAAALAVTLNYLAEVLFMIPFLWKEGAFRFFHIGVSSRVVEASKLFLMYMVSSAVMQINTTIDRWLASSLAESSI